MFKIKEVGAMTKRVQFRSHRPHDGHHDAWGEFWVDRR
jgi:hypothetical protein